MQELQIFIRYVYGNPKLYPANDVANTYAQLLGVKTFNDTQLSLIKHLGFTINVVADPSVQA